MTHAEAVSKVFPSEFTAGDYVREIAARLDALEEERATMAKRVSIAASQIVLSNNPAELTAYTQALVMTCAKISATDDCLRDALRSHGRLKAYVEARASDDVCEK